jgi:uncharacterized protein YndB with AHSA1/START domain
MWKAQFEMLVDLPAEALYNAITDIDNWNKWDVGLEYTRLHGEMRAGATFLLKPKGGPRVKMSVDDVAPYRLVDTAHLLGAKLRTTHEYLPTNTGTTIRFGIEVWGPLGFFWRKILGEPQIKEAPAQLAAFVAYARGVS